MKKHKQLDEVYFCNTLYSLIKNIYRPFNDDRRKDHNLIYNGTWNILYDELYLNVNCLVGIEMKRVYDYQET